MDDQFVIIAIAAGIMLVLAVVYFDYVRRKKRREAFALLAQRLGLRYSAAKNRRIDDTYGFLNKLRQGSNRYAYNTLEGDYQGHPVVTFDYHYETYSTDSKGRIQTLHHRFSFFILCFEASFPELRIYPETFFSKLGQMLGYDDIDFESVEFSKAFTVRSTDKKFAYDICHTGMMEYLLGHKDLALEIEAQCLAMGFDRTLKVEEVEGRLEQLIHLRSLVPAYLFKA